MQFGEKDKNYEIQKVGGGDVLGRSGTLGRHYFVYRIASGKTLPVYQQFFAKAYWQAIEADGDCLTFEKKVNGVLHFSCQAGRRGNQQKTFALDWQKALDSLK